MRVRADRPTLARRLMPTHAENRPDDASLVPRSCPYCNSSDVSATGKVTAASYYRCQRCGQVWHPDRLGPRRTLDFRSR